MVGRTIRQMSWAPSVQGAPKQLRKFREDGRSHDLTTVRVIYGVELCDALIKAAGICFADLSPQTAGKYFNTALRFLCFIAARFDDKADIRLRNVFGVLASYDGLLATERDWKFVIEEFSDEIQYGGAATFPDDISKLSVSHYLDNFVAVRKRLFVEMGWPDVAVFHRIQRQRGIDDVPLPSLGELYAAKKKSNDHDLINSSNAVLLQRLRRQCEIILYAEEKAFDSLDAIILRCPEEDYQKFLEVVSVRRPTKKYLANLRHPVSEAYLLPAALRYVREVIEPNFHALQTERVLKRLLGFLYPLNFIKSHFEGSADAMIAAALIIQIDTGINNQVCDSLAAEPVKGVVQHGKVEVHTISSVKNRADYKRIRKALPQKQEANSPGQQSVMLSATPGLNQMSAVSALRIWQKLSKPVRTRYATHSTDVAKGLWIMETIRGGVRLGFGASEWKAFRRRFERGDRKLSGLRITRRHIRPTFFQVQFLKHSGDAALISSLANHSSTAVTLNTYLAKAHLRRTLDEHINAFQNQFESIFGEARERAAQLMLSVESFSSTRAAAIENGLGFLCRDPGRGIQPGTQGKDCTKLDACTSCPLLVFQPSEKSIFQVLWFKASLDLAEETFVSGNPERWAQVWLPAQALCIAVIELLASGPFRKLLGEGERSLESQRASGVVRYFIPW